MKAKIDLRTRAGQEQEVLEQIRTFGGFTSFWISDHNKRISAFNRLVEAGRIKTKTRGYPWIDVQIIK